MLTTHDKLHYITKMDAEKFWHRPFLKPGEADGDGKPCPGALFNAMVDTSITFSSFCADHANWLALPIKGVSHRYTEREMRLLWDVVQYQRKVLHHEIARYMKQREDVGYWSWPGNGNLWSGAIG